MSEMVCIICLDTDSKLYNISKYKLEEAYEHLTGLCLHNEINLAPTLCSECVHRLIICNRFRDKSLKAHTILLDILKNYESLSVQNIKAVNRINNELTSNLVMKIFEPDHCDDYIIENEQDDKKLELLNNVHISEEKFEVKYEKPNDIVIFIEPKTETIDQINSKKVIDNEDDDIDFDDDVDNKVDYFDDVIDKIDEFHNEKVGNVHDVELISDVNIIILNEDVKNRDSINAMTKKSTLIGGRKRINSKKNMSEKSKRKHIKSKKKAREKPPLKLFKSTPLSYEEQVEEVNNRQTTTGYIRATFKCTVCFTGFISLNTYNRHMVKHTNKCGEFICALCHIHCIDRRKLVNHLNRNHFKKYSCTSCNFVTKDRRSAELHERWHNGTKYKCPKCAEEFNTVSGRLSHLRIKHPSDFICFVCGYSFISKKGINDHMRLAHRFENIENPQGPECTLCKIRFASEAAYNQHVKVSPKHSSDGLRIRNTARERYHLTQQYITCEQCGIQVKDYWAYSAHFKNAHPDINRTHYGYLCELCGKVYKNEIFLRYHMAAHAGEKLLQCELCEKRFNYKPLLMLHMKVHSDSRPLFDCPVCNKSFTSKANRNRHVYIHKEKSFKCELCGKAFTTDYERRGHVLHVHLKKPWPKKNRGPKKKAAQITFKDEMIASLDEGNTSVQHK